MKSVHMEQHIFLKVLENFNFTKEAQSYLQEMVENLPQDLSPGRPGYYSFETLHSLHLTAAEKLAALLNAAPSPNSFEDLRKAWAEVVIDYHRNNNWNFPVEAKKPKAPLTLEQKSAREVGAYVWLMIQTAFLLKTAVYYFGMHSASEPSTTNTVMLIVALFTTVATMFYFAWRRSRKDPKE